jgi:hypothetical protein
MAHVQGVRLFTRDFAELNLLTKGQESSDRMIAFATMDFLSDFNGTPPFSSLTLDDMYRRFLNSLAVRGTVVSLLQSLMIFYSRNHLPYSDGGLSVNLHDKAPIIMSMLSLIQSGYEQNKRLVKTSLNVESIMGEEVSGVLSDYSALSFLGLF